MRVWNESISYRSTRQYIHHSMKEGKRTLINEIFVQIGCPEKSGACVEASLTQHNMRRSNENGNFHSSDFIATMDHV